MRTPRLACFLSSLALVAGCAAGDADVEDGENDSFLGKADSLVEGSAEARAVLALVNDPGVDFAELDVDAGLSSRVARNIITKRDGADATPGTADDDRFDTLAELDAVPYIGSATLAQLLEYAIEKGLLTSAPRVDVIFSPQPVGSTHTARVAQMIGQAQHSIDIAMYSYSDAGIGVALGEALARGVKIRFLFDTAAEDRKLADLVARTATKSGKLEKAGIDVRWVNKVLHHKFILIDGPRDDASLAKTGRLVTGSANWSNGGATVYDENTLFIDNSAELNTLYAKEFDLLWTHSRDFVLAAPIAQDFSEITQGTAPDDANLEALFTSPNFGVNGDTFTFNWRSTVVSDQLVAAIGRAQTSIYLAQGHLRLRPLAEALIAAKQARPSLDIKVHLDQQEYISASGHTAQVAEVNACLATADTEREVFDCKARDFLFAKALIDAGIDVRFKSFAYRWDASYAVQMHSKYMIIDGNELYTGSYNLSMNSEQSTFENVVHLQGSDYAPLIAKFQQNFTTMRELGRASGALATLRNTIQTAQSIPLVFAPLSLTWQEFGDLRALIRANCPLVDSVEYRTNPAAHKFCPRG